MSVEQVLLLVLLLVIIVLVIALKMVLQRGSTASRRRVERALKGEEEAEALLEGAGFEIIERQAVRRWTVEVDGEKREASVRADLLVRRDGFDYVAEVKTGDLAPDPLHPSTRRQLLEYLFVFEPEGLLLVDVEAGDIVEVDFPGVRTRYR